MIKSKKVIRVLLPIHSIQSLSIQPLHFLLYPSILTYLIYHTYHLFIAFHLLPPLHNLLHQPPLFIYSINTLTLLSSAIPLQCSKSLPCHLSASLTSSSAFYNQPLHTLPHTHNPSISPSFLTLDVSMPTFGCALASSLHPQYTYNICRAYSS